MAWQRYWYQWVRRWRLSEMRLLFLALWISALAVAAVGFFTDRVESAMERQASQVLGGDLVVSSSRPLPEEYQQLAQGLGANIAEVISFRSMLSFGESTQLVQVKAVSPNYPLIGELQGAKSLTAVGESLKGKLPASGELWSEPRLFHAVQAQIGSNVALGRSQFALSTVVTKDPSQGVNFFQIAPQVMIPLADLPATGLLSPASRAEFSLLFTGSERAIRSLKSSLKAKLAPTERIRSLEEGAQNVQQALQRAGRFLGLAALLSVVLAGAAIVLTAASLVRHETRSVAVLKAFGLARRRILIDYLGNLWLLALVAGVLGALVGFLLQELLAQWLVKVVEIDLPPATWTSAWVSVVTALVMVTGFALPSLVRLLEISPMQILQGSLPNQKTLARFLMLSILPAIFILFWIQAREFKLALWVFLGLVLAVAAFWLISRLVLHGLARLSSRAGWQWLALMRQSRRSILLVVVFAIGLFSLLLLTALRTDLIGRWQASVPADAPNYFLINIQTADQVGLDAFLKQQNIQTTLYPMIRGRLVEINNKPVTADNYPQPDAKRMLEREFNLSSFADFPASNSLISGQWFDAKTQGFSIEQGIGETLGFNLGDRLTFDIAGQRFTETITSVREVRWDSMQPNFFVIAAPGALLDKPYTLITSLHVPTDKPELIPSMIRQFPSITAIDTSAMLGQIRSLVEQATLAVQGVFAFTLVTGLLVLWSALQAQKPERQREIAVLKSLGANSSTLRKRIWLEFLLLGGLAGVLAGLLTMLAANWLGFYMFDLQISLNPWLAILGTLLGATLVASAAWLNLRSLLKVAPMVLLKT